MCLTGVDYFSTLGYQPGIAFLAAEGLSPLATVILVLLTLFGALPIYNRVAEASPHGNGSISMLEELLPRWKGKAFVLCLLGFAATDFVITITLSAADATAHVIGNPFVPAAFNHPVPLTLLLLAGLIAVFLKGFKEAIGLAVWIVGVYLVLNAVVIGVALFEVATHPQVFPQWKNALYVRHGSPLVMLALALWLFPKVALGLSGFETGVAVMPLVKGDPDDDPAHPKGRIRNTKKLLHTAAVIMSVLLIGSSIVTTLLIPLEAVQKGGEAYGRALSYLAHGMLGEVFGTIYDLSTISILWFAGASAMAGLLGLVPRYLPRYGMAPEWAKATRPLVLMFAAITVIITLLFKADVEAQGGAYATGVLVLITSAAVAATLNERARRRRFVGFLLITVVFIYTTFVNMYERPEGLKIAAWFIATIILVSLVSRVMRSTELQNPDRQAGRRGARLHPDDGRRAGADSGDPAGRRTHGGLRAEDARSARIAQHSAGRRRAVPRDPSRRRVRLRRHADGHGRDGGRLSRPAHHQPGHPERDRRAAALHPRRDRPAPARVLRLDRRQPDRLSDEVPGLRRRRHRAGHARGAAPDRV